MYAFKGVINYDMDWDELNSHVQDMVKGYYNRDSIPDDDLLAIRNLFKAIQDESKITTKSIEGLVNEGWIVISDLSFKPGYDAFGYAFGHPIKEIILTKGLYGYVRDLTLFHEVVHAHFLHKDKEELVTTGLCEYLIEWKARQLRADPKMLKKAVLSFNLEPNYYQDKSCLEAFFPNSLTGNGEEQGQLTFPFSRWYTKQIPPIYMNSEGPEMAKKSLKHPRGPKNLKF